jgi:hypothetical protein
LYTYLHPSFGANQVIGLLWQLISGTLMEVIMILHFVNDSQKVMTAVSVVLPSKCCGGFYAISLRMFHFVSKCDCFS